MFRSLLLLLVIGLPLGIETPAAVALQISAEPPAVQPPKVAERPDVEEEIQRDLKALQNIVSMDAGESVNHQLTQLGLKYLPEVYNDTKKWGKTKEFKTLIPRSEPLVLNHGTWRKYTISPVDQTKNFRIRIKNLRSQSAKIYFTLQCDIVLDLEARQAKWVRGVQLYSVNAVGTAGLTLSLDCAVKISFDFTQGTVMVVTPTIESSDLEIHEFRIHRVSKVGGEVSQQITRAARDWLDDHEEENEKKLVEKLNKQIVKNQDKLRLRITSAKSAQNPTIEIPSTTKQP